MDLPYPRAGRFHCAIPLGFWRLFWSDWREAFLISRSYGMGDPMAPSEGEGNSAGGGTARRIASRQAKRAGITRP
jgi:hypothetical protein